MPLEARTQMVSFRLTPDERDRFRELCLANGLPSISEMARIAIKMMFGNPRASANLGVEFRVAELETRVAFLFAEIRKLSRAMPSEARASASGPALLNRP